jgi:flagellar biosynthesis protein FlhB
MMTKPERKEEERRSEGDPKVKGRIRSAQRQLAKARIHVEVPKAAVVVRNPTHFAVALRYERGREKAPKVVAKGRGLFALRIIRIAERAMVPIVVNRPLARELYKMGRVGSFIPEVLYRAVAEVLAFVYRKAGRRGAATAAPLNGGSP